MTHPIACPVSKQPELKACAVQLVTIKEQQEIGSLADRGQCAVLVGWVGIGDECAASGWEAEVVE